MRILLILIGVIAAAAGGVLLVWPRSQLRSQPQTPEGATSSAANARPQAHGQADPPTWLQSPEPLTAPDHALDFTAASGRTTGRVLHRPIPAQNSDQLPVLSWQALPQQGNVRVLIRSARGGLDGQRWFQADWQLETASPKIHFSAMELRLHGPHAPPPPPSLPASITASLNDGVWQVALGQASTGGHSSATGTQAATAADPSATVPPILVTSALDAARAIAAVHQAFADPGQLSAGDQLSLAAVPHLAWPPQAPGHAWLLPALPQSHDEVPATPTTHPDRYPRQPDHWSDWRLWLTTDGTWHSAEHLHAHPGSPDDPGQLVRRVQVLWR